MRVLVTATLQMVGVQSIGSIPEPVVEWIAARRPRRAVFRDAGFAGCAAKLNVLELFKRYMPESANDISKRVKVI